jgi:hypothetical protein
MNRFKFKKDFKKLKNFLNLEFSHFFFRNISFFSTKKKISKKVKNNNFSIFILIQVRST